MSEGTIECRLIRNGARVVFNGEDTDSALLRLVGLREVLAGARDDGTFGEDVAGEAMLTLGQTSYRVSHVYFESPLHDGDPRIDGYVGIKTPVTAGMPWAEYVERDKPTAITVNFNYFVETAAE